NFFQEASRMGRKEVHYLSSKTPHSDQDKYYYHHSLLQLFRPLTLSGTISPVLAATALASLTGNIDITIFIFVLAAALFVQIAINIFNDYFDFKNGQDQEKWMDHKQNRAFYHPAHHHLPYI